MNDTPFLIVLGLLIGVFAAGAADEKPVALLERYCFDCHDDEERKGDLDLVRMLDKEAFDASLLFENLITGKMPPANKKQPTFKEKRVLLNWLAQRQAGTAPKAFRRISRHEFVHSLNDLLGTKLDFAHKIPEDRGTSDFDSNRRIQLSQEMLGAYFTVADEMLEFAFPTEGFPNEQTWVTSKVKDSHFSYNIYLRPYLEGQLFSWTRANNGNSYSFFYDHFDPPVSGWYELSFDAAKVGAFEEDVSLQVYAGKYYYADDRPQPQRLLGVISLGDPDVETHRLRAFLHPGESVSVHCYSKHTFRQKDGDQGAYIEQLHAQGPVLDQWPPRSFDRVFQDLPINAPSRERTHHGDFQTNLQNIGGKVSVSSFQEGMEKEKMQDGSNRTFWHTRFEPTLAEPPHYVILENPRGVEIEGLIYATWSGGNGNGQVTAYAIHVSDDGESWGDPIMTGELEVRLANEQPIPFPNSITNRYLKFLITDAQTIDGRSLASIGKLDVMTAGHRALERSRVSVGSRSQADLKQVIERFAESAFSSKLTEEELQPYFQVSLDQLEVTGDFIKATKSGLKAILCSPRFLMAPGEHANPSYATAADLARSLWLSVPDEELLTLSRIDSFSSPEQRRAQIHRMLRDEKGQRLIRSFSDQWLNLRSLRKVTPSLKLYPEYDDLLDYYLPLETQRYLSELILENRPVVELIDSNFTFLNQRLAQHYKIDGVYGQDLRKVTFGPEVPRGGLLTMGSVLKVTTDGYDTSPILRGAWISKNLVGTPLSPPPENVSAIEPEHGETAATLREQIEQHKNQKSCYACHKSIDPYGFALESFDATGQWRTRYRVKKVHKSTFQYRRDGYFTMGSEVDASGEIDAQAFDDVFGLKKVLLSDTSKIAYNFAKKFFEYAEGYPPSLNQRLKLMEMISANSEGIGMKDLVTEVLVYTFTEAQP
jgi:hypothetical protein